MKFYESGAALAAEMGVPVQHIADVHQKHYEAAQLQAKDPEGAFEFNAVGGLARGLVFRIGT